MMRDWDDYAVRAARRWAFEDALDFSPRLDAPSEVADGIVVLDLTEDDLRDIRAAWGRIAQDPPKLSIIPSHLRAAIALGEPVSATVDGDRITYSEATD